MIKGDSRLIKAGAPILGALLVLLLFLPPLPALPVSDAAAAADSREEIAEDPLGRLPSNPEEAHGLLEERDIGWPTTSSDLRGDAEAASVRPGVNIALPFDYVEGNTNHANAQVKVDLIKGGIGPTYTEYVDTTSLKWFYVDWSALGRDIESGDKIRVRDMAGGAVVEIDCTLTGAVDAAADRVTGTAPSGTTVDVYIAAPSTYYRDIPPGVAYRQVGASGGTFRANFGDFNILRGDAAYIFSTNPEGNKVLEVANTGGSLVVYPQYDEVMGFYQPFVDVTVKAGSATMTDATSGDGFYDIWFMNHDIVPGDNVSSTSLGGSRSINVGNVFSICDPYTNVVQGWAPADRLMRITMDVNGDPVVVETRSGADGTFSVDLEGIYTVTGNEVYNVAWYNDDEDCVIYEWQTFSWYLPEGYTGQGFDEWVLVMNPMQQDAWIRVIFQTSTGPVEGPLINAMPGSRVTVHVNDWTPNQMVSTMVTSIDGTRIMAERAMYMYGTVDGKWGAHDSIGILAPSSVWYLPEGATYFGFDEWVLLQNPNEMEVTARVQFLEPRGVAAEFDVSIGARSRYTIHANEHVPDSEISTKVTCLTQVNGESLPIFAERAMYMATADGKRGAHDSIGLATPRPEWYLPEGTTRPGFDEWVLVMNPNDFATTVEADFLTPGGVGGSHSLTLQPNSRGTIHVNDFVVNQDVSTVVRSREGAGILAERAMYMDTADGKRGAHDSIGASQTDTFWYLPEGTTRPGFDEWVLVQNPSGEQARVRVTLLGPSGPAAQVEFDMRPQSRYTVHVNDMVQDMDVSTVVESIGSDPVGILAERAMYMWTADFKQGAHDSISIPRF